MSTLLLILALLLSLRPPEFSARWLDARTAELRWSSDATHVCIDRLPAWGGSHFLGCYRGSGALRLPGGGPNDYAYFPKEGDRYVAWFDDVRVEAALHRGYVVHLPLIARAEPPRSIYLPLIGATHGL